MDYALQYPDLHSARRVSWQQAIKADDFVTETVQVEHIPQSCKFMRVQSTTRITEFFVVGKMSAIIVGFVILVGQILERPQEIP